MIISYKKRTFCFYPNFQLHSSVGSFLKANQRGPLMFAVVYLRRLLHQAPRSVCGLSQLTLPPLPSHYFVQSRLHLAGSRLYSYVTLKIKFLAQEHSTMT